VVTCESSKQNKL